MTSLTDLMVGNAELLDAAGLGVWDDGSDPEFVYPADAVAITLLTIPDAPAEIISITGYVITDDPLTNDSVLATQLRMRGPNDDIRTLADRSAAVFNLFAGLQNVEMGGLHVVLGWRQSSGPMGIDENQRCQWADTYYWRCNWDSTHRTY